MLSHSRKGVAPMRSKRKTPSKSNLESTSLLVEQLLVAPRMRCCPQEYGWEVSHRSMDRRLITGVWTGGCPQEYEREVDYRNMDVRLPTGVWLGGCPQEQHDLKELPHRETHSIGDSSQKLQPWISLPELQTAGLVGQVPPCTNTFCPPRTPRSPLLLLYPGGAS